MTFHLQQVITTDDPYFDMAPTLLRSHAGDIYGHKHHVLDLCRNANGYVKQSFRDAGGAMLALHEGHAAGVVVYSIAEKQGPSPFHLRRRGEIDYAITHRMFRRQGIYMMLMDAVLETMAAQGLTEARFSTRRDMHLAQGCYNALADAGLMELHKEDGPRQRYKIDIGNWVGMRAQAKKLETAEAPTRPAVTSSSSIPAEAPAR